MQGPADAHLELAAGSDTHDDRERSKSTFVMLPQLRRVPEALGIAASSTEGLQDAGRRSVQASTTRFGTRGDLGGRSHWLEQTPCDRCVLSNTVRGTICELVSLPGVQMVLTLCRAMVALQAVQPVRRLQAEGRAALFGLEAARPPAGGPIQAVS